MSSKNNSKAMKKAKKVEDAYTDKPKTNSDPNGSWTGIGDNKNEIPTQDADDL